MPKPGMILPKSFFFLGADFDFLLRAQNSFSGFGYPSTLARSTFLVSFTTIRQQEKQLNHISEKIASTT
jgi:hypothetical protein